MLLVQKSAANWLQYVHYAARNGDSGIVMMRRDRAPFVAFDPSCQSLRIGAQIYNRNDDGEYHAVPVLHNKQGQIPYVEEFAIRGHFVVLATRRSAVAEPKLPNVKTTEFAANALYPSSAEEQDLNMTLSSQSRSGVLDDKHEDDSDSNSSDDASGGISDGDDSETSYHSDDEAYESWSDCSSGGSEDSQSEEEILIPNQDSENEEEDQSSHCESSENEASEGSDAESDDKEVSESSSEESDVDPRAFRYGQRRNYGDEYDDDLSDNGGYCNISPRERKSKHSSPPKLLVFISVFDTRHPVPDRVFHLSRKAPCMLYDSPPVMHPSQSLVVWPLGGGNILFANFLCNTFFIRKLRASTLHSKPTQCFNSRLLSPHTHFL